MSQTKQGQLYPDKINIASKQNTNQEKSIAGLAIHILLCPFITLQE